MTWYAAHVVIGMKRSDGIGPIEVLENVVLVEAATGAEAKARASEIGVATAALDDGLIIDDVPAIKQFAGVRKVVNVSNPFPLDLDQDQPTTGTEITYSEFEVADEDALRRFARGESLNVDYLG